MNPSHSNPKPSFDSFVCINRQLFCVDATNPWHPELLSILNYPDHHPGLNPYTDSYQFPGQYRYHRYHSSLSSVFGSLPFRFFFMMWPSRFGVVRTFVSLFFLCWSLSIRLHKPVMLQSRRPAAQVSINSMEELARLKRPLASVTVTGNTSSLTSSHPTVQLVLQRIAQDSKPGRRPWTDKEKIALSIEGGGMRGCVSAGAVAALNFLGLNDAVDVVYGSSAGAMVGAYFVSRQYSGVQIYHGKVDENCC